MGSHASPISPVIPGSLFYSCISFMLVPVPGAVRTSLSVTSGGLQVSRNNCTCHMGSSGLPRHLLLPASWGGNPLPIGTMVANVFSSCHCCCWHQDASGPDLCVSALLRGCSPLEHLLGMSGLSPSPCPPHAFQTCSWHNSCCCPPAPAGLVLPPHLPRREDKDR